MPRYIFDNLDKEISGDNSKRVDNGQSCGK